MLDDLAATVENLRSLLQALGHAIEPGLVFEVGNGARPVRASGADRAVTTGSSIAVIDFGEIAQPAVADRRQHLPGRADISVAFRVVSETRPCGRSPRAPRSPALRSGNVRDAAGLLAGLDVLGLAAAAVGDDVDRLDVEKSRGPVLRSPPNAPCRRPGWSPPARRSAWASRRRRPGCYSRRRLDGSF